MAARKDVYSNLITDSVTQGAVDETTFQEVNLGLSVFDKVGLLINRLEYQFYVGGLGAAADPNSYIQCGLSTTDGITVRTNEREVVDLVQLSKLEFGTPDNAELVKMPVSRDMSTLPGGGILVTPRPLYFFVDSDGLADELTVSFRVYFTIIQLKPEEYFELLETRQYYG